MNQMIHLRLEPELKKQIDSIVKGGYYGTATDFIKEQIRKGIFEHQKQQSIFAQFRGIATRKTPLTREERIEAANYVLAHPGETFKRYGWKVSEPVQKYQKKQNR